MTRRVMKVCGTCGGDDVRADAYASWDIEAQDWTLSATFDKGSICRDCDGQCTIVEVPIAPRALSHFPDEAAALDYIRDELLATLLDDLGRQEGAEREHYTDDDRADMRNRIADIMALSSRLTLADIGHNVK